MKVWVTQVREVLRTRLSVEGGGGVTNVHYSPVSNHRIQGRTNGTFSLC